MDERDLGRPWATPAYLAGLNADLWILCAPELAKDCAYRAIWTHERLTEAFGANTPLDLVRWTCPACGGGRVSYSLRLRDRDGPPEPARYAISIAPLD